MFIADDWPDLDAWGCDPTKETPGAEPQPPMPIVAVTSREICEEFLKMKAEYPQASTYQLACYVTRCTGRGRILWRPIVEALTDAGLATHKDLQEPTPNGHK